MDFSGKEYFIYFVIAVFDIVGKIKAFFWGQMCRSFKSQLGDLLQRLTNIYMHSSFQIDEFGSIARSFASQNIFLNIRSGKHIDMPNICDIRELCLSHVWFRLLDV